MVADNEVMTATSSENLEDKNAYSKNVCKEKQAQVDNTVDEIEENDTFQTAVEDESDMNSLPQLRLKSDSDENISCAPQGERDAPTTTCLEVITNNNSNADVSDDDAFMSPLNQSNDEENETLPSPTQTSNDEIVKVNEDVDNDLSSAMHNNRFAPLDGVTDYNKATEIVNEDIDNNNPGSAMHNDNELDDDNMQQESAQDIAEGMADISQKENELIGTESPENYHRDTSLDHSTKSHQSTKSQSSLLDLDFIPVTESEMDADILSDAGTNVLSDAGESKYTAYTTAPVINMTMSGESEHDEKLVALGVFAKAANADGDGDNMIEQGEKSIDTDAKSGEDDASEQTGGTNNTNETGPGDISSPVDEQIDNDTDATIDTLPIASSPGLNSTSLYDKKRLSERLRQRLAKRNEMLFTERSSSIKSADDGDDIDKQSSRQHSSYTMIDRDASRDRAQWESRLREDKQKRRSKSRTKSESNDGTNSDILSKYSASSEIDINHRTIYPDTVSFGDDGDNIQPDDALTKLRFDTSKVAPSRIYRKAVSEVCVSSPPMSTRSKLSRRQRHSHHHGIGILQSDGIVYDDPLLLRLARQARVGRGRGLDAPSTPNTRATDDATATGGQGSRRTNHVKIHVYDLLAKDSLVEVPYLGCNFPVGQCFRAVNNGCHVLGTGAYHVGVEINGVEYAFGANNITGMSGIFTCVPKESPGYEYRETLDFGTYHTTKRTWIRIPNNGTGASFNKLSGAFSDLAKSNEKNANSAGGASSSKNMYTFRDIDHFADGHAIVHSMAREYMGTDYDLLRKNCCTFSRDVCIRLGVKEDEIPRWFHNAAEAGADAEDAIANAENSVRKLVDCSTGANDNDDCLNHGFEVIMDDKCVLRVVEAPAMRAPRLRRPLSDSDLCDSVHETASWVL